MENQVEYIFPSEQIAYRFMNTVRNWDLDGGRVRLGKNDHRVAVGYRYSLGEFDTTAAKLDDLAASMDGQEA